MSANAGTLGHGGMDAFDELPERLRRALANHHTNMSSEFALDRVRSGASVEELVAQLSSLPPPPLPPENRLDRPKRTY